MAPAGDFDPREIQRAIGSYLTSWEMTEVSFAYLFNATVRPDLNSEAIRRAYGSITSARTRKGMIEEGAKVFFKAFPENSLAKKLRDLLKVYDSAATRRNEVAHGIILAGLPPHTGWYLEANMYSSRRDVARESPYAYTSTQLYEFQRGLKQLGDDSYVLADALRELFQASRATRHGLY